MPCVVVGSNDAVDMTQPLLSNSRPTAREERCDGTVPAGATAATCDEGGMTGHHVPWSWTGGTTAAAAARSAALDTGASSGPSAWTSEGSKTEPPGLGWLSMMLTCSSSSHACGSSSPGRLKPKQRRFCPSLANASGSMQHPFSRGSLHVVMDKGVVGSAVSLYVVRDKGVGGFSRASAGATQQLLDLSGRSAPPSVVLPAT